MIDIAETELEQNLDASAAAYMRRVGRPRYIERLTFMLKRACAAQQVSDEAIGADEDWKRLGEEVRKLADEILPIPFRERKAAE